jgi:hypothetical protein
MWRLPLRQGDLQWGYDRSDDLLICPAISFFSSEKASPMFVYNVPIPKKALDDIVVSAIIFAAKTLPSPSKEDIFIFLIGPLKGRQL